MTRELLTIRSAMRRAQVSRSTIYNWRAAGKIAFTRTAGGAVRIYADTLFTPVTLSHTPAPDAVAKGWS